MYGSATRTPNTPKRKLKASASQTRHNVTQYCADDTIDWARRVAFVFAIVPSPSHVRQAYFDSLQTL